MSVIAVSCIEDIENRIKTVPAIGNRVFHVSSEDEIIEKTKGVSFPCVGVIYSGMTATNEAGSSARMGQSAELVVSILLFFRQDSRATNDPKDSTVAVLDEIRRKIMATKSPSNHFWRFKVEAAVEGGKGLMTYLQRWSTPVQLTPAN